MATFYVDNTPYPGHQTGTAQGGGVDAGEGDYILLSAECGESDDAYNGWGLKIVSGTGAGQSYPIKDYEASNKRARIQGTWITVPDATSVYVITYGCDGYAGQYSEHVLISGLWYGPFASIDKGMQSVGTAGVIYVKAGTPYTWDNGSGVVARIPVVAATSGCIKVLGYKDSPGDSEDHLADPAYQAVLDGQNTLSCCLDVATTAVGYLGWELAHLLFKQATGNGVSIGSTRKGVTIRNCVAESNGGTGFDLASSSLVVGCEAFDNGGKGIATGPGSLVAACRVYDNANHGVYGCGLIEDTVVYGIASGKVGIYVTGSDNSPGLVRNCTVDGYRDSGISIGVYYQNRIAGLVNTIIFQCGWGVQGYSDNTVQYAACNLYYGNTLDRMLWTADQTGGSQADPKFLDADGHDYRLRSDSPAIGAGLWENVDLGARQCRPGRACSPTNVGMQT